MPDAREPGVSCEHAAAAGVGGGRVGQLEAVAQASIEIASIHTRDEGRDGHLKSAEFFDAEQFPAMTLKSTQIVQDSEGELVLTGDLTIKGVTKSVQFAVEGPSAPAKDPWGNIRVGVEATAKINRKDFGLVWNAALETGGVMRPIQFRELRQLVAAGRAPGAPERHEHRVAPEGAELESRAAERAEIDLGRHGAGGELRAGTRRSEHHHERHRRDEHAASDDDPLHVATPS